MKTAELIGDQLDQAVYGNMAVSQLNGGTLMVAKYAGLRFSSLTVIGRAGSDSVGRAMWRCTCDCGNVVEASSKQLAKQHVRACSLCQDSGSRSSLEVRLQKYTSASNGCWDWTGKKNQDGYGAITVEGRYTRAHRAMYFMLNPEADKTLVVMHTCDNPQCVNPSHLKLGTQKDNILDMHLKGRFKGGAKAGNQNAKGNKGWMKGGITAKYVVSILGDEIEIPKELT